MNEQTLGPWESSEQIDYDQGGNKFIDGYAVFNKDGLLVADDLSSTNAHLISAAPEMLESLENIVGLKDILIEIPTPLWQQIYTAIAKAKGE